MSLQVVIGIVRRDQDVLIAKRPHGASYAGFWEFPGGKVERGESHDAAICRELKEELGITVALADRFYEFEQCYPSGATISFALYDVKEYAGIPCGNEGQDICWTALEALSGFKMPAASSHMIDAIGKMQS